MLDGSGCAHHITALVLVEGPNPILPSPTNAAVLLELLLLPAGRQTRQSPLGKVTFIPLPSSKPLVPEWIYIGLHQQFP